MKSKDVLRTKLKTRQDTSLKASRVASALLTQMRGKFGEGIARATEHASATNMVSSGIDALDVLLPGTVGNNLGGFPCGRITELFGVEDVGKTTIGCRMAATVQQRGGVALLVDTESTLTKKRMLELGVNPEDALLDDEIYIEKILDHVIFVVNSLKDTLGLVFIDTIASTQTIQDRGKKVGEKKVAGHATAMSDGLRKLAKAIAQSNVCVIACNQKKQTINESAFASARDSEATLGGSALRFHSVARVRLERTRNISVKRGGKFMNMGFQLQATAVKNKLSGVRDARVQCVFNTRSSADFDNAMSTLRTLQSWGAVAKASGENSTKIKLLGKTMTEAQYVRQYKAEANFRAELCELLVRQYAQTYLED